MPVRYTKGVQEHQWLQRRSGMGLRPHCDLVPESELSRRNHRVQCILAGCTGKPHPLDKIYNQTTVFVAGSHLHTKLFKTYWRAFHPILRNSRHSPCNKNERCVDCEEPKGCPQFFWDFHYDTFIGHAIALRELLKTVPETECLARILRHDPHPVLGTKVIKSCEREWECLRRWATLLEVATKDDPAYVVPDPVQTFRLVAHNFQNGELVLFMPGIVHWVMSGHSGGGYKEDPGRVLFKAIFELYKRDDRSRDENGWSLSDGRSKCASSNFERCCAEQRKENFSPPRLADPPTDPWIPLCSTHRFREVHLGNLLRHGVVHLQAFCEKSTLFVDDVSSYLETLLDFPAGTHLSDPFTLQFPEESGLLPAHLYRSPGNLRTSIFPKGHGNTGMGGCSELSHTLKQRLDPLLSAVTDMVYENDETAPTTPSPGITGMTFSVLGSGNMDTGKRKAGEISEAIAAHRKRVRA